MPIRTKRWNEPIEKEDGRRILITRFRPRALPKSQETWDEWRKDLSPSPQLVKAYRDPDNPALTWEVYRRQYLREMKAHQSEIDELAAELAAGKTITLLCSSSCLRESRCHRSLLRELIEKAAAKA